MGRLEEYILTYALTYPKHELWVGHEVNPTELLSRLRLLKADVEDGIYPASGICYAAKWESIDPEQLFEEWPQFSGNEHYPVPHPNLSPRDGYERDRGTLWVGEYGDMRKSLLNHMIKELEVYCNAIA